jgi:hypothetical protein
MFEHLKTNWQQFKEAPSGQRFQMRFRQRQNTHRHALQKYLAIIGGIVLMATGLFLMAVPGPGVLVLAIGAGFVAQESRYAAKLLDAIEPPLLRASKYLMRLWRRTSTMARIATVSIAVLIAGMAAVGAYRIILQ